eukprot:scaffold4390_cov108-Isochrysis_galbana.AAC.8
MLGSQRAAVGLVFLSAWVYVCTSPTHPPIGFKPELSPLPRCCARCSGHRGLGQRISGSADLGLVLRPRHADRGPRCVRAKQSARRKNP